MKLAVLMAACAMALGACSGVEEIALNARGNSAGSLGDLGSSGSAGASAGGSATSATGGGGASSLAGSAGSTPTPGGGVPNAGGHAGVGGQPIMPQGGTNPVGCAVDANCPAASPYCRGDGKCVACLNNAHCVGDDAMCELVSGTCTVCAGGGGAAGGDCGP